MKDFKSALGLNIKLIRKAQGVTQENLAEIIGLHSRQLSKIETGEHFPSYRTFEKICLALNTTPKELFNFDIDIEEQYFATGTDDRVHVKVTPKDNVYELFPQDTKKVLTNTNECTDETMLKTAKALNKPVIVEYKDPNKKNSTKIVAFYPDRTEKILKSSIDVEYEQNINFMLKEFKKISKDKQATEFVKTALLALEDDDALEKLENIIYGMKLSRK